MTTGIAGVDLTDDEYRVKQSLVRNKYRVDDANGDLVLRAKQKLLKMKEEFPFVDADGDPAFTVKAEGILDISGDYAIVDDTTDETVAILDKHFTFFLHEWTVRDPDGERALAKIESRSTLLEAARSLIGFLSILPHRYSIETPDGEEIGEIEGELAVRDYYTIRIDDSGDVPKEALVASAIAVDALEGN